MRDTLAASVWQSLPIYTNEAQLHSLTTIRIPLHHVPLPYCQTYVREDEVVQEDALLSNWADALKDFDESANDLDESLTGVRYMKDHLGGPS